MFLLVDNIVNRLLYKIKLVQKQIYNSNPHVSNFRIMWINLLWLPFVVGCRMTKFVREEGLALENHVITTVTADQPIKCEWDCVDTPLCFSINVHAQKLPSGWVTCDLNNSSRKNSPRDLAVKTGYRYHEMAVSNEYEIESCKYKSLG